jgi:hypothetical protein
VFVKINPVGPDGQKFNPMYVNFKEVLTYQEVKEGADNIRVRIKFFNSTIPDIWVSDPINSITKQLHKRKPE